MDSENLHARPSLHLPLEIIEQILAILPVKSLLRFKCVSKLWCRLIGSDQFIKIQLQKSRDDTSFSRRRVIFSYPQAGLKHCSFRSYLHEPSIDPSPIEDRTNNNHLISGTVVDSINGVLCILQKPGRFSLYNPSTRNLNKLPKIDKEIPIYGFGWDETSDAYKVFAVFFDKRKNRIGKLYSSKTGSWKTVAVAHGSSLYFGDACGVFACGKIHWLTESRHHLKSFDLKSEVFDMIELPCKPEVGVRMWLSELMGCISVCVDSRGASLIDVWILKEYGVKKSWVKKVRRLPQRKITDRYGSHFYVESLVSPVQERSQKKLWSGSCAKQIFRNLLKN